MLLKSIIKEFLHKEMKNMKTVNPPKVTIHCKFMISETKNDSI